MCICSRSAPYYPKPREEGSTERAEGAARYAYCIPASSPLYSEHEIVRTLERTHICARVLLLYRSFSYSCACHAHAGPLLPPLASCNQLPAKDHSNRRCSMRQLSLLNSMYPRDFISASMPPVYERLVSWPLARMERCWSLTQARMLSLPCRPEPHLSMQIQLS